MAITRTTFHDLLLHLQDTEFGIGQDAQQTILKRATRMAYRDVLAKHRWEYFLKPYHFFFNGSYATGTCVYDHTGGSSERLVTLSDGTVPTWAEFGVWRYDDENYDIDKRLSDTTFTLKEGSNPGADVASTSEWKMYRDTYPMPDDFQSFSTLREHGNYFSQSYVTPDQWMQYQAGGWSTAPPFCWTIMANPERGGKGKYVMRVIGQPSSSNRATIMYRRLATEPVLAGIETNSTAGTIAVTAGSRTVTGTSTAFSSNMAGAVLRWLDATYAPTGNDGLHPFAEEHIIESVASTTSLTLETDVVTTASGVKYVVSDLLDADQAMTNVLYSAAEYYLATLQKDQGVAKAKSLQYRDALLQAMAMHNHNSAVSTAQRQDWTETELLWPYPN